MPTPPNKPRRTVASLRELQRRPLEPIYRALDSIPELPGYMTRRGVVKSFLAGLSGLTVACVTDGKGGGASDDGGDDTGLGGDTGTDTDTDTSTGTDTGAPGASAHPVSVWLNIAEDDIVTVVVVKNEMGQGIATGMAMVVADELDADWEQVRMSLGAEMNDTDLEGWSDGTWGSTSMTDNYAQLREIGAAAREMLVQAAADRWGVDASELSAALGVVSHPEHGALRYGELAEAAGAYDVPTSPQLKDSSEHTIIGREKTRLDIAAHTRGQVIYGMDVVVEDMLYAAVKQSPVFGGEVANIGDLSVVGTEALAVVPIPNGVAVVADSWWTAKEVLAGLDILFETPPEMDGLSSEEMAARFIADLDTASAVGVDEGNADVALEEAAIVVASSFGAPMLAHATMEPLVATADVRSDQCTIWISTQYAKGVREAARSATGLPESAITVHPTALGGGFGRKAETDYALQAVIIAASVGQPVKVIWSREEDIRHDYYRPPTQARITGGLDADGYITAWKGAAAGTSYFSASSSGNLTGFHDFAYQIPNRYIAWAGASYGVPFGFLRAPGHNKFNFMVEGFMDELADAAGVDPLDFRLRHLGSGDRASAVLERVAEIADWGSPGTAGAHHGCSLLIWGNDGFIAQVAEVSVGEDKAVTVHHVWVVADVGRVINPDLARSQLQGSVIFGLSTGLYGKITLTDGAVDQSNFHDYPMLKMADAPEVTVAFIDSDEDPGGVGEHAVGGAVSAVLNAMARADGERVYSLPITDHDYS